MIHWITSESNKERHHLPEDTAKDINNKLDKLPQGLNKGNGNEYSEECNHRRNQEIKRRGEPMERSTNKTYHINYPPL